MLVITTVANSRGNNTVKEEEKKSHQEHPLREKPLTLASAQILLAF